MVHTRSQTKKMDSTADPQGSGPDRRSAHSSRAPSPTPSATSSRSSATTVRRQRLLALQLEAAEEEARIRKELIAEKLRLQTEALHDMDDEDIICAASQVPVVTPTVAVSTVIDQTVPVNNAPTMMVPANSGTSDMDFTKMFLARQTTVKELSVFSGDPEDWPLFYSQFISTTKLCKYSDDENIARLCKCLKGKARDAVLYLLVSATNLDKIIQTLKLRFGRPDQVIEIMLSKIQNFHNFRQDDINSFIEFATIVQNIVATMVTTNEIGHLTNPTLIKEIVNKLPTILKFQWSFYLNDRKIHNVTLSHLSDWLMEIANATTTIAPMTVKTFDKSYKPYKQTVLATDKSTSACVMCKYDHTLDKCPEFLRLSTDDRWKYVTTNKMCFSCLSRNHQLKTCKRRRKCSTCDRVHHSLLHAAPLTAAATVNHTTDGSILLKVARVVVSGPDGDVECLALCDEGASVSLIDQALARRLGVTGPSSNLRLQGASGMASTEIASRSVSFKIRGLMCDDIFIVNNVRTVNNLSLPVHNFSYNDLVCKYDFLNDFVQYVTLTDMNERPLILLGQDNIDLIVTRHVYQGPKHAPIVSVTNLGYIVHGKLTSSIPNDVSIFHLCACEELNDAIRKSFSTEGFGTKPEPDSLHSREDLRAMDIMRKTTRLVGNRWETGLLWKDDNPKLPDSYRVARQRLEGVERKMNRCPELAVQYKLKIKQNIDKGYLSKLTHEQKTLNSDRVWYLPHFAVFNPNKPKKIRIVLDCAAKSTGKCLNDYLICGPDFLTSKSQVTSKTVVHVPT